MGDYAFVLAHVGLLGRLLQKELEAGQVQAEGLRFLLFLDYGLVALLLANVQFC